MPHRLVLFLCALSLFGCTAQFKLVTEDQDGALLSVRGTGPDDVWVCGADGGTGPEWLHWDGTAWERIDTSSYAGVDLWWLAVRPDRVTAVGSGGTILTLDRESGDIVSEGPGGDATFFGVIDDGVTRWAVGGNPAATVAPLLWRNTTGAWEDAQAASGVGSDGDVFFKIAGSGDDLVLVGNFGLSMRFDGTAWTELDTGTDVSLLTVDVGAEQTVGVGGAGNGVILHLESGAWVDRSPELQPGINGVCSGGGRLRAVGATDSMHTWEEGAWTTPSPSELPTNLFLDYHGCWFDSDGTFWGVGGNLFTLTRGFLVREGVGTVPEPG